MGCGVLRVWGAGVRVRVGVGGVGWKESGRGVVGGVGWTTKSGVGERESDVALPFVVGNGVRSMARGSFSFLVVRRSSDRFFPSTIGGVLAHSEVLHLERF